MSNILERKIKMFIRDLMGMNEASILSGRDNNSQNDFNTDLIVVDDLSPSQRLAGSLGFDGDSEVQTISNTYITSYTIDFYGDNAYSKANDFALLVRSQQAYELKKSLGIGIYQVSSIQDLKKLTGQQYSNRYQVTIKIEDTRKIDIDTLRIDEAQIEVTT